MTIAKLEALAAETGCTVDYSRPYVSHGERVPGEIELWAPDGFVFGNGEQVIIETFTDAAERAGAFRAAVAEMASMQTGGD